MKAWLELPGVRFAGAEIWIHWSVLAAVSFLLCMSLKSPIHAVVAISSYLGIIVIHEMGHAFAVRRLGYGVGAISIGFLHGVCEYEPPRSERDFVLIAWSGVLAQLAVAIPVLVLAAALPDADFGYLSPAIAFLGYVNLVVALFNLAPAPGFDGEIAWRVIPLMLRKRLGPRKRPRNLQRRR